MYCSITGYGPSGPDSDRPGLDALVAARTGQHWEIRGVPGTTISRLSGTEGPLPGLEIPEGCWVGPDRDGPLFSGVPWVSLATFYIASLGINAAIRVRGTDRAGPASERLPSPRRPGHHRRRLAEGRPPRRTPLPHLGAGSRAPKAFFQASDGRWLHHWVPLPEFIINAAANGMKADGLVGPKQASMRVSTAAEDMIILHAYQEQLAEAVGPVSLRRRGSAWPPRSAFRSRPFGLPRKRSSTLFSWPTGA